MHGSNAAIRNFGRELHDIAFLGLGIDCGMKNAGGLFNRSEPFGRLKPGKIAYGGSQEQMPVAQSEPIETCSHSGTSLAVVGGSSIHGSRLVAKQQFKNGELILPLLGRLTVQSSKTIQIGINAHLRGTLIAFMNHSCSPTGIVDVKALRLVAAKDIGKGEEITFFYPSTEWQMVLPFRCLCGAANCIAYIAGARYLSSDLLGRYFTNPHIRRLAAKALAEVDAIQHTSCRPRVAGLQES